MSLATLREESKATVRRPIAKVIITWTDPLIDLSINTEVSENNRVSYPVQVADLIEEVPRKWFHTNDTDMILDGTFYPAPSTLKEARISQMGWWGTVSSGAIFREWPASTAPTLSVSFTRRLVRDFTVTGDSALGEYPVNFTVTSYDTVGGEYVPVDQVVVIGNTLVSYTASFAVPTSVGTRITLEVTKWSHADKIVKIAEFYSSIVEEFSSDDIMQLNILQEFESAEGTLPVGNISCNELDLSLQNITDRFFSENTNSDIHTLIRRNRKIEPFLGFQYKNGTKEYVPMGLYWSGDWVTTDNSTVAQTSARDRFELMRKKPFPYDEVFTEILSNVSIKFLMTEVLESLFGYMYDLFYDISDMDNEYIVPHFDPEFFKKKTYFDVVKELSVAGLLYVYMDTPTEDEVTENGPLCKDMFRAKRLATVFPASIDPSTAILITKDDFIDKSQLADTESMANTIDVVYKVFSFVDDAWEDEEVTLTVSDADSITEYGVMDYEYQTSDLIQEESHAEDVANSLLESFKIPKRDIDLNAFGDITIELANQMSVPEYQKSGVDRRGVFAITKISPQYDGSLRMVVTGRKLADDNSFLEFQGRGVMAEPSVADRSGVMSFPSVDPVSGYMVEPFTIGREADTYVVPDSTVQAPAFTVQPVDQTVASGGTATFGPVTVTGSPTPTLQAQRQSQYFEGSSSDNFVEAEWAEIIASGTTSWDGATVTLTGTTAVVWNSNYAGCVESAEVRVTAGASDTNRILHIMNVISANDRIIATYNRATSTLTIQTIKSGSSTFRTHVLSAYDTLKTVATATRSGDDWVFNVKIYTTGDVLLHDIDETFVGQYNPAVDYFLRMQGQDGAQTYTFMRIEGNGFPNLGDWEDIAGETSDTLVRTNIGTTGDCFGTNYRFVGTNTEGVTPSNTVTTIEA